MDAIETLMNEHRLIESVLDALVGFTDEVKRKSTTEKEELSRFVAFIREFADACHHGKEEDILFVAMVDQGFPREGGPIGMMLLEHEQGRAFVRELAAKAAQAGDWSDGDRQQVVEAAADYANLLHGHIHKEDAVLYPMAEQHLSPEALERVAADCERFEAARTDGDHERYHQLADTLVARYAASSHPAAPGAGAHRHGCCG